MASAMKDNPRTRNGRAIESEQVRYHEALKLLPKDRKHPLKLDPGNKENFDGFYIDAQDEILDRVRAFRLSQIRFANPNGPVRGPRRSHFGW